MTEDDTAAYADAASAMLDLPLPPDCRPGVIANLALIFAQTADLMALTLDAGDEPLPVFRA